MLMFHERQARQTRYKSTDSTYHDLVALAHSRKLIPTRGTFYFLTLREQTAILERIAPVAEQAALRARHEMA